jgi:hypothetical protein
MLTRMCATRVRALAKTGAFHQSGRERKKTPNSIGFGCGA